MTNVSWGRESTSPLKLNKSNMQIERKWIISNIKITIEKYFLKRSHPEWYRVSIKASLHGFTVSR
jgi:hypothetical protein